MILEERTSVYNDKTARYSDFNVVFQENTYRMFIVVPFTVALAF